MSDSFPVWINDGHHDLNIAEFVIEGDPFVDQLTTQATDELRGVTGDNHGSFRSLINDNCPENLGLAVQALYMHLKNKRNLIYGDEPAYHAPTEEQQIRVPALILSDQKTKELAWI